MSQTDRPILALHLLGGWAQEFHLAHGNEMHLRVSRHEVIGLAQMLHDEFQAELILMLANDRRAARGVFEVVYLFANRRANRLKVLVHDGIGVWLAARRLNIGKFTWSNDAASTLALSGAQFDALVLGLPWQLVGEAGIIRVI